MNTKYELLQGKLEQFKAEIYSELTTLDIRVAKLEENDNSWAMLSVDAVGTSHEPMKKKPKCIREIRTIA